jgi:hypothetical protein
MRCKRRSCRRSTKCYTLYIVHPLTLEHNILTHIYDWIEYLNVKTCSVLQHFRACEIGFVPGQSEIWRWPRVFVVHPHPSPYYTSSPGQVRAYIEGCSMPHAVSEFSPTPTYYLTRLMLCVSWFFLIPRVFLPIIHTHSCSTWPVQWVGVFICRRRINLQNKTHLYIKTGGMISAKMS